MTDYQIAIDGMASVLKDPELLIESFKRGKYPNGFQTFYLGMVPTLDAIERLFLSVGEPDTMLDNMAQTFVDQSKALYDAAPRRRRDSAHEHGLRRR